MVWRVNGTKSTLMVWRVSGTKSALNGVEGEWNQTKNGPRRRPLSQKKWAGATAALWDHSMIGPIDLSRGGGVRERVSGLENNGKRKCVRSAKGRTHTHTHTLYSKNNFRCSEDEFNKKCQYRYLPPSAIAKSYPYSVLINI
jgi:hypothetical protein